MSGARDQVGRLLALVPYIQSRDEVSVQQAADDFDVSAQQIRKDLNVLWFCGLPGLGMGDLIDVDMDALEGEGVIRISNADYLHRPLRLGSTEASALIVALRTLREGAGEDVRPAVDRVLAKLEAAAGEGAAHAAQVDVIATDDEVHAQRVRGTLEDALGRRRQVRLGYYVPARDEATVRTVDPLRVGTAEGHGYLDAWCHQAEGQRLFRLDRVSEVTVLDTPLEPHDDVTPRDLSAGIFQPSPEDLLATVLLAPSGRWVAEYYPVEHTEETPDGGLRVTLRVGDPAWLVRLMLRLGDAARVEAPDGLAAQIRDAAAQALGNYA